jgi:hypothetical protein
MCGHFVVLFFTFGIEFENRYETLNMTQYITHRDFTMNNGCIVVTLAEAFVLDKY